jgi:integron integrase
MHTTPTAQPPKLLDQIRNKLRVKHYAIRTEEQYLHWIKRFILFHGKRHPKDMGAAQIEAFLTNLAVIGKVSASTQNQAKSALLFMYREVFEQTLPWLDNVTQARVPKRLPVVLTVKEVQAVLAELTGTHKLIAGLLYGVGLRLMEAVRLRVKDVEFARGEIIVRDGKGGKDRVTMLPDAVAAPLKLHLARVKALHNQDLTESFGEVYLPFALDKKYPYADKEWGWQYIFPSINLSIDPRSGKTRRHHLDEKGVQRAMKQVVVTTHIAKPATPHTLRHYPEFKNMPSEVGGARAGGARGRIAQVWQSAYSAASERIEKRKQLVVGSKAAGAPRSRINFVQCRLLHLEIGLDIDLCRLDRFVPEPRGDHATFHARLQKLHRHRVATMSLGR